MLYAATAMGELHTENGPRNSDHNMVGALPEDLPKGNSNRGCAIAGELPEELPRGLVERLEDLQRRLGHCEGRLELAQVMETILRKQLKRESERADRLEEELRRVESDLRAADTALHKTRRASQGWFKRFFGISE